MKRILAIDDVGESLITIRSILRKTFEVMVAKSGAVGFQVLERNKADLILLDIEMPEMSGFEFMELLLKNPSCKEIPVVFVTSTVTPEFVLKASKAGVKGYVLKPVDPILLVEKIEEVFRNNDNVSGDIIIEK